MRFALLSPSPTEPSQTRTTHPRRRIKKAIRRALMAVGLHTVPYLYVAYMWFVYKTSRVEEIGFNPDQVRETVGKAVYAVWHDEVFCVAWSFGKYRIATLASPGDSGSIITRMLELCHFDVFRGGSTMRTRRGNSVDLVRTMIAHLRSRPGVIYGITTDGSMGPVYRLKKGVVSIAVGGEVSLCAARTWCKRYFRLRTWDRTFIPLPFNHIVQVYAGPMRPPRDAWDPKSFEALRKQVERLLCLISAYARRRIEGLPLPQDWLDLFPEELRDEMARAEEPPLRLPIELVVIDRPPGVAPDTVPGMGES